MPNRPFQRKVRPQAKTRQAAGFDNHDHNEDAERPAEPLWDHPRP